VHLPGGRTITAGRWLDGLGVTYGRRGPTDPATALQRSLKRKGADGGEAGALDGAPDGAVCPAGPAAMFQWRLFWRRVWR
jgi:hypothetical protein